MVELDKTVQALKQDIVAEKRDLPTDFELIKGGTEEGRWSNGEHSSLRDCGFKEGTKIEVKLRDIAESVPDRRGAEPEPAP